MNTSSFPSALLYEIALVRYELKLQMNRKIMNYFSLFLALGRSNARQYSFGQVYCNVLKHNYTKLNLNIVY